MSANIIGISTLQNFIGNLRVPVERDLVPGKVLYVVKWHLGDDGRPSAALAISFVRLQNPAISEYAGTEIRRICHRNIFGGIDRVFSLAEVLSGTLTNEGPQQRFGYLILTNDDPPN